MNENELFNETVKKLIQGFAYAVRQDNIDEATKIGNYLIEYVKQMGGEENE